MHAVMPYWELARSRDTDHEDTSTLALMHLLLDVLHRLNASRKCEVELDGEDDDPADEEGRRSTVAGAADDAPARPRDPRARQFNIWNRFTDTRAVQISKSSLVCWTLKSAERSQSVSFANGRST